MDNAVVSEHYNERRDEGQRGRTESPIIGMRNFNNWVKSVLIAAHTRPGYHVLDLCSGKGGDLNKWSKALCTKYVACDTAGVSIQQASERYNGLDRAPFRPVYLVGDCFKERLSDFLPSDLMFNVVSCQFAVHYAFESEERVRQMLTNVTERLQPGGFFIGTTPDANVLVRKLRAVDGLTIGNKVFRVDFDEAFSDKKFPLDKGPYGIRYNFTLDQNVEDCPEYLVHFPTFAKLAGEYELELILLNNFHDFYNEFSSERYGEYRSLFQRMRILNDEGTISLDEWDSIYLYTAFVFKKRGKPSLGLSREKVASAQKKWADVMPDEIVDMADQPKKPAPT